MKILKSMQGAVDEYIQVHAEMKKLENHLKELRGIIEPFMEISKIGRIGGSAGGALALQVSQRPPMNAKYTSYELDILAEFLTPKVQKKVVVPRIDKDLLEAIVKLGEAPKEILDLKITSESRAFVIKTK